MTRLTHRPKATLFAAEGIKQIDEKLAGDPSGLAKLSSLEKAKESLSGMKGLKIELVFVSVQLAIMRSEFAEAKEVRSFPCETAQRSDADMKETSSHSSSTR